MARRVSAWCPVKEGGTGAAGVNLLSIKGDELGVRSLCWSVVAPCPLQICSPGLEPALLLNAERCIFMRRGRCFSPPASPVALRHLWSVLLCLAVKRAPGGLCLGKLHAREDADRAKKKSREGTQLRKASASSLGGKKRCLSSRRGGCELISKPTYFCCSEGAVSEAVGKSSRV